MARHPGAQRNGRPTAHGKGRAATGRRARSGRAALGRAPAEGVDEGRQRPVVRAPAGMGARAASRAGEALVGAAAAAALRAGCEDSMHAPDLPPPLPRAYGLVWRIFPTATSVRAAHTARATRILLPTQRCVPPPGTLASPPPFMLEGARGSNRANQRAARLIQQVAPNRAQTPRLKAALRNDKLLGPGGDRGGVEGGTSHLQTSPRCTRRGPTGGPSCLGRMSCGSSACVRNGALYKVVDST